MCAKRGSVRCSASRMEGELGGGEEGVRACDGGRGGGVSRVARVGGKG